MDISIISNELREALATQLLFRLLGFTNNQIYISLGENDQLCVVIRYLDKEFVVGCGKTSIDSHAELLIQWSRLIDQYKIMSEKDLTEIYESSQIYQYKVDLVVALILKGIDLPVVITNKPHYLS
jgi:hypothetical protein